MNLTLEEFLKAACQAKPQLDLGGIDENTDIRTGLGLDSLQMMLMLVILGDRYEIDPEQAAKAATIADFCEIAVRK